MIQLIAIGVAALALFGGGFWYGWEWQAGRWAKAESARLTAEAQLAAQTREIEQDAQNKITDMEAAYEAGQSKARTVFVKVQQRAQADVGAYPVFSNRACDWPPPVVQLVRGAFANLHAPADTAIAPAALPAPAPAAGGAAGSGVPVVDVPARPVEPVRDDARAVDRSNSLSTTSTGRPPKPIPRAAK